PSARDFLRKYRPQTLFFSVIMGIRHTHSTDRRAFKIDLNQYGRLFSCDPGVVSWRDGNHLRSGEAYDATIRILNVNATTSKEADMRVHAQISAHKRLDISGP